MMSVPRSLTLYTLFSCRFYIGSCLLQKEASLMMATRGTDLSASLVWSLVYVTTYYGPGSSNTF